MEREGMRGKGRRQEGRGGDEREGEGREGEHRGRAQRDNGNLRVFGWQSNNRNDGRTGGDNTGRFGTT